MRNKLRLYEKTYSVSKSCDEKIPLIVLGLDGISIDMLDSLIRKFSLNNLATIFKLNQRKMVSTIPPLTTVAWTSIFTGLNPGRHGVFSFFKFNKYNTVFRVISSKDIKVPRLWEILSKFGYQSFVANIPLSSPFKPFLSIGIPDWLSAHPQTYVNRKIPAEVRCLVNKEKKALTRYSGKYWHIARLWPKHLIENIVKELMDRILIYEKIIEKHDWDSIQIVFSEYDWISHLFFELLHTEGYSSYYEYLRIIFRRIDKFARFLMKQFGGNASYLLISDHGFKMYNKVLSPKYLLMRYRLIKDDIKTKLTQRRILTSLLSWLYKIKFTRPLFDTIWKKAEHDPMTDVKSLVFIPRDTHGMTIRVNRLVAYKHKIDPRKVVDILIKIFELVNKRYGAFLLVAKGRDIYWGEYTKYAPDVVLVPNIKNRVWITYSNLGSVMARKNISYHDLHGIFSLKPPGETSVRIRDSVKSIFSHEIMYLALISIGIEVKGLDNRPREELIAL